MMPRLAPPDGVLLVDKPRGITSHDVVARLRRAAGTKRIGHTGTLDPMATGLLVICLGPATRVAQFLTRLDKIYAGTITFGSISSTYDAEGDVTPQSRPLPSLADVREAMSAFIGEKVQLPPPYSAVKVAGKKLYEYARNGEAAPPKPRIVRVRSFELNEFNPPLAHFTAHVGSGTYIRTMAHDLGLTLGCGAYLSSLRRTQVGGFSVEDALALSEYEAMPDLIHSRMMSLVEALGHLPKLTLQPAAELAVRHGRDFVTRDILEFEGALRPGQPVLVLDERGTVLSIAQGERPRREDAEDDPAEGIDLLDLRFRPLRVLAHG